MVIDVVLPAVFGPWQYEHSTLMTIKILTDSDLGSGHRILRTARE